MRLNDSEREMRPWLTMLHGFSQDARLFARQVQRFAGKFRVFCPELLGHGQRPVSVSSYTVGAYAADVLSQLRERGIERTHFWGTHTGTAVGLYLALEQPLLLASLILEAPVVPGLDTPTVKLRIERARRLAAEQGVPAAMDDWFQHAEWFRAIRAAPLERRADAQRAMVLAFKGHALLAPLPSGTPLSLLEQVRNIPCPALIYTGSEDVTEFREAANWLARELRHGERLELEGLGGFPAWEAPERVDPHIEAFLERVMMTDV